MAHQSHSLPWNTLASNFTYAFEPRRFGYRTNFVPSMDSQQGKKIEHFVKVFTRILTGFSSAQKEHYALDRGPVQPNQRFISREAIAVIKKSVDYARNAKYLEWCGCCCPLHFHGQRSSDGESCSCEIYTDPCILGYWLNILRCGRCCYKFKDSEVLNLTKILLLHNHMEPLLCIASQPNAPLEKLFDFPWDHNVKHGWAEVHRAALHAYIALNVIYLKPDTWPSYQQANEAQGEQKPIDYRLTAMFQRAVRTCTGTRTCDVDTLPHRFFFGIPKGALRPEWRFFGEEVLVGRFPLKAQYEKGASVRHAPTHSDVNLVRNVLRSLGLPMELVITIMDLAKYEIQSRLVVSDDPLHPSNAEELRKYLSYCWRLMVRCDLLANACGQAIDWGEEVKECISNLFFDYPECPKGSIYVIEDALGPGIAGPSYTKFI